MQAHITTRTKSESAEDNNDVAPKSPENSNSKPIMAEEEKKVRPPIINKEAFKERLRDALQGVKDGTQEFSSDVKAGAQSAGATVKDAGIATKEGTENAAKKTEKWTARKLGQAADALNKRADKRQEKMDGKTETSKVPEKD